MTSNKETERLSFGMRLPMRPVFLTSTAPKADGAFAKRINGQWSVIGYHPFHHLDLIIEKS